MDTIAFDIEPSGLEDYLTTKIFINGLDLRAIIGNIEYQQMRGLEYRGQAGAYEGISPFIAFHLHNHFWKETINEYRYAEEQYALYEYAHSGVPGDHTLTCRIEIDQDRVVWSHFKNYSTVFPNFFHYGDLCFSFSRYAYSEAMLEFLVGKINPIFA